MTNPTPNELRELARAALAGSNEYYWTDKLHTACTPAVIIALCDRLEGLHVGLMVELGVDANDFVNPMTTPLLPAEAGGRP